MMTEPTNPSPEQPQQTPPADPVPPPADAAAASASAAATPAGFDQADIEQNKVMAVLAYILFLIPLLAAPKSPFARFHTNQGLNLFIVAVGSYFSVLILLGISMVIAMVIPILSCVFSAILGLAGFAVFVGTIVLVVIGIINAANGQAKKLPVVGNLFNLIK